METVLSWLHYNSDFSIIPEGIDNFFSGYATLQEGENVTFLVNNINGCLPGTFLHQFLWYTLKVFPVAPNISLLADV